MEAPTVYVVVGDSAMAHDERGEIVEALMTPEGAWDWENTGICDHRGSGGPEGYAALGAALNAAERVARLSEVAVVPVAA